MDGIIDSIEGEGNCLACLHRRRSGRYHGTVMSGNKAPSILMFLLPVVLVAGCATTPGEPGAPEPDVPKDRFPEVTLELPSDSLRHAVRQLGEQYPAGLVLMHGLGDRMLPALAWDDDPYETVVAGLAEAANITYRREPYYYFLYPARYESLLGVSFAGRLPAHMEGRSAGLDFGAGTKLYNVLALLGATLDITLVADNAVAEARCGEVALARAPLAIGLEALFKSARIPPDAFEVDATAEYTFFARAGASGERSFLHKPEALTAAQRERLEQRVTLILPHQPPEPGRLPLYETATPLGEVLESLSRQLGVTVRAEAELTEFPVNPCVFNEVRVQTALDLLLRQWLVHDFVYEFDGEGILIRAR